MKLAAREVERFLRRPDPGCPIVLIYGPDAGLVRERAEQLGRSVVEDLGDAFRVSELRGDALAVEPRRLLEEAQALCMLGGRRLVRVRDAGDEAGRAVSLALGEPIAALVVIEAGALPPASKLRQSVERAKTAAALPCYHDDPRRDLPRLVRETLGAQGLTIEDRALEYVCTSLGGDRGVTRQELDKLILYMGNGQTRVRLEDAAAAVGDSSLLSLEDATYAALAGGRAELDRRLDRLFAEGMYPGRALRALSQLVLRFARLLAAAEDGTPIDTVVERARPPFHFARRGAAKTILGSWSPDQLARMLARLTEGEAAMRRTGAPAELLCRALFTAVAGAAPSRGP